MLLSINHQVWFRKMSQNIGQSGVFNRRNDRAVDRDVLRRQHVDRLRRNHLFAAALAVRRRARHRMAALHVLMIDGCSGCAVTTDPQDQENTHCEHEIESSIHTRSHSTAHNHTTQRREYVTRVTETKARTTGTEPPLCGRANDFRPIARNNLPDIFTRDRSGFVGLSVATNSRFVCARPGKAPTTILATHRQNRAPRVCHDLASYRALEVGCSSQMVSRLAEA